MYITTSNTVQYFGLLLYVRTVLYSTNVATTTDTIQYI